MWLQIWGLEYQGDRLPELHAADLGQACGVPGQSYRKGFLQEEEQMAAQGVINIAFQLTMPFKLLTSMCAFVILLQHWSWWPLYTLAAPFATLIVELLQKEGRSHFKDFWA